MSIYQLFICVSIILSLSPVYYSDQRKTVFRFGTNRLFFLYEKESLLRDNDVCFKAGWELAHKQN